MAMTEEQIAAKEAELAEREEALGGSGDGDLGNKEWKSHPNTTKLTQEIAELRRKEDDRVADEKKRSEDAAIKDAEAKEQWEEAKKLKDAQHKKELESLKATTAKATLKAELAAQGFGSDSLDYLVYKYDPEAHPEVTDYAKAAFEDAANAKFLKGEPARKPKDPPGTLPAGGETNWDEIRVMEKSDKRADRMKARDALKAWRKDPQNKGKMYPYEL